LAEKFLLKHNNKVDKKHMKTKNIILSLLSVAAVTVFFGCSSSGYKQADKTSDVIAEFSSGIMNGKQAIDATLVSLNQVSETATTDPRKAFEQYSKDVAKLESAASRLRSISQDVKAQGKSYFANWEKQLADVKNPEIRNLALERKEKLQLSFDVIRQNVEPLKAKFDLWMSDLKDLEKYLGNDLTIAGLGAAKGLKNKTIKEGREVQKSIDALVVELNNVSASITPAKVAK